MRISDTLAEYAHSNLAGNPFEVFELFEPGLTEDVKQHENRFKSREELMLKVCRGIIGGRSYKVVFHEEAGIGKSSLMNKILCLLRGKGYLTIKYRIPIEIQNPREAWKLFAQGFLMAFGEAITAEALQNAGFLEKTKTLSRPQAKKGREEQALLSVLYASDQVTGSNQRIQTESFSTRVGIPVLSAELVAGETEHAPVARTETLSHDRFTELVRRSMPLVKKFGCHMKRKKGKPRFAINPSLKSAAREED